MISLVDETLRLSRRIVGKAEKSSGRSMNRTTVKIRIATANEAASPMSSTQAGIGRIIITMIAISATAMKTVGWRSAAKLSGVTACM